MQPCIDGVKAAINEFVAAIQSAATVDFRVRLIAYRDLHDPTCGTPWQNFDFTSSSEELRSCLGSITATGGGGLPESTLDALFLGLKSPWRPSGTHKTVILLTDADTHQTLHASTYDRPDNGVGRVIQEFQTMRHAMLFIVAPRYDTYVKLERAMQTADRKVIAHFLPVDDTRYEGLKGIDWSKLLTMIGQTVSQTSIAASAEAGRS